jgi:hypothetical protein
MIDISCVNNHLHPGPNKQKIDRIQQMGNVLAVRVIASFNLVGRRAVQFTAEDGERYQALIHNEADDTTDYLVIHPVGVQDHTFEAVNVDNKWITTYLNPESYDLLMRGIGEVLLEYINTAYSEFIKRNEGFEPDPLSHQDIDLDSFSKEMSHRKITMSHHGNMRLAYR